MCGIAGFISFDGDFGNISTLKRMGDAIAHRGPDASGEYIDREIGLCHRRLSIIDLSSAGNQPMHSESGRYIIVFNGEIYNFIELKKDLVKNGCKFQTQTDTEVILALYERHEIDCLQKLNGMFAFAIWDKQKRTLFLARDRLGKKPLYYYDDGKHFIFASEIKSILTIPSIPRNIRHDAIYDYFTYQYIPDPKTIFNNIYKLSPGHYFIKKYDRKSVVKQYWDVTFQNQSHKNEETIKDELYDKLFHSTRRRMVSDVPLGAFLSGGIDSSGIVALMAKNSKEPITTCAIGFDSKNFDEVIYAKVVADKYMTNHHELTVRDNVSQHIEYITSYFDEPFADPSYIPTYFVSKLARQKVTVALAGDGGDENFAGYQKYTTDHIENLIRSLLPSVIRKILLPSVSQLLANGNSRIFKKGHSLTNTLRFDSGYGFFLTNSFFDDRLWNNLINDNFRKKLGDYHPSSITENYYHNADTDDHLSKILYTDIKTYLAGDILVKVDRMSMANSLEVRAPILDFNIVEYAATIPSHLKYNKGEKKYILKRCFSELLPKEILYRKKMGFSVPLAEWFRHELRDLAASHLFTPNNGLSNFFKIEILKSIWDEHQSSKRDYSNQLWSLLIFELWWKKYCL